MPISRRSESRQPSPVGVTCRRFMRAFQIVRGVGGVEVQLEAVLAGVAGARHDDVLHAGHRARGEVVVADGVEVHVGERLQDLLRARGPAGRAGAMLSLTSSSLTSKRESCLLMWAKSLSLLDAFTTIITWSAKR